MRCDGLATSLPRSRSESPTAGARRGAAPLGDMRGLRTRCGAALSGQRRAVGAGAGTGPPAGFGRVADAIGIGRGARRPLARWLTPRRLAPRLGAVLAAAAVTAAALIAVYQDDHRTAERYRETLAEADGRYFDAEPLTDETGSQSRVRLRRKAILAAPHGRCRAPRRRREGRARYQGRAHRSVAFARARPPRHLGRSDSRQALRRGVGPPARRQPGEILQASFPRALREGD